MLYNMNDFWKLFVHSLILHIQNVCNLNLRLMAFINGIPRFNLTLMIKSPGEPQPFYYLFQQPVGMEDSSVQSPGVCMGYISSLHLSRC